MTIYGIDLWAAALVFARLGTVFMLLPGFGEPAIPVRIRLIIALLVTALLTPLLQPQIAPMPVGTGPALGLLFAELIIGLIIGAGARLLLGALNTAGQIIGLQTGLAFAQTADPTQSQGGQLLAVFLTLLGLTLVFTTNLHHSFIRGIAGSYGVFTAGAVPSLADSADLALTLVADSFRIAVQISAPLIVAGLVFQVAMGVLSRAAPQIQVFFVTTPISILGGLLIMLLSLSAGMLLWLDSVERFASGLAG